MATPTLDAYRQLNPDDQRPDTDVVPELLSRLQAEGTLSQYPDLIQYAGAMDREYRQAHPPGFIRDFTKSLSGGLETGQSQLYSTLAQGADATGLDQLKEWALRGYQRHAEKAAANQPFVPSASDVHGVSDALHYGVGLVGSQTPALAATVGSAALGGAVGSLIGPEGTVGGALAGLGEFMGAAPKVAAALGGSTAALAGAGYVQSQNYGQLASQPNAQDALLTSAAVGAAGGLLMTIVPSNVIRSAFGAESQQVAKVGIDHLLERAEAVVPNLSQSILAGAVKHGSNNALLGVGNELVSMAGEMYSHRDDPNFQISDKELTDRILNGAAAGGVIGAAFGAAGASAERNAKIAEAGKYKAAYDANVAQIKDVFGNTLDLTRPDLASGAVPFESTQKYADYEHLFDDAADLELKRQARERYDAAREAAWRQSDRQKELLQNQLSQQAGGEEIQPVNFRPNGPEEPPAAPTPPEPQPIVPVTPPSEAPSAIAALNETPGVPRFTEHPFEPKQDGPFVSLLPRKLIDLANNPRGGITPDVNGNIPTKSLPGVLKRLGVSQREIALYKDVLDEHTKTNKVNLPALAQDLEKAAPKLELKELTPRETNPVVTNLNEAQHDLESAGFRGSDANGRPAIGEVRSNRVYVLTSDNQHVGVYNDGIGGPRVQTVLIDDLEPALANYFRRRLEYDRAGASVDIESDAATGRYGVEPKPLDQMPGAVDVLGRLPSKEATTILEHASVEARRALRARESEVLYEGPHFGKSDKNVLFFWRAYREGDTLHLFEVQSDWAQKHRENPEDPNRTSAHVNAEMKAISDDLANSFRDPFYQRQLEQFPRGIGSVYDMIKIMAGRGRVDFPDGVKKVDAEKAKRYLELEQEASKRARAVQGHPLLHDYETLAIKAAIHYAQQHGLKKIALSDAETAMMTEGHDRQFQSGYSDGATFSTREKAEESAKTFKATHPAHEINDPTKSYKLSIQERDDGSGGKYYKWLYEAEGPTISQEKGMRAAYDERLPNILRKLTGDRGELVDFGQHKSATPVHGYSPEGGLGHQIGVEGSPVFRNQFGPKDNITARIFRIDHLPEGQKPMFDGPKVNPKTGFVDDIGELHEGGGPMEHGGELPLESMAQGSPVKTELPKLREEFNPVRRTATKENVLEMSKDKLRAGEKSINDTKRLIAVENVKTGQVEAYPVYVSNNIVRVHNGVEDKVTSRRSLAEVLGYDERSVMKAMREGGSDADVLNKIWDELRAGAKPDDKLEDLLNNKAYRPVGFLYTEEPVGKHQFKLGTVDEFMGNVFSREEELISKNRQMGSAGVDPAIAHLTKISVEDSRGVQILASVLENMTQVGRGGAEARADAQLILSQLLKLPDARVFKEELNKIKDPNQLLRRKGGRLFGLFTDEQWKTFKELTAPDKDVSLDQVLAHIDTALEQVHKTRSEFMNTVTPKKGQTQTGVEYRETDQPSRPGTEDDDDLAKITEAGAQGESLDQQAVSGAKDRPADIGVQPEEDVIPEKAFGFARFLPEEVRAIVDVLHNPPKKFETETRNILEARAEGEISNPKEDLEFQAVKDDLLRVIGEALPEYPKRDLIKLTDDQLYSVYANLDRSIRDSQPVPSSYRETSERVQQVFRNTVRWLGGQGVDVRLIQQNVDSAVEFLRKEWGRSISAEDGKRMIILTMQDVNEPSRENLRTLYHEISHQLFANEQPYVQRLIHEAVERLNDLQLDVFSKTFDQRLINRDKLPPHVLFEEILAEHLAFTGIDQTQGRTIAQKITDAFTKLFAQAAMVVGKLTGKVYAPELIKRYAEIRFQDMLDRTLNPKSDLDTLSGNIRYAVPFEATMYKRVEGGFAPEFYDAKTGSIVPHDVMDDSALASQFNLDNKLQYSDIVVRDSRADIKRKLWEQEFGFSDTPVKIGDVLQKIVDNPNVTDVELKAAAMSILDRSKTGPEALVKNVVTADEIQGIRSSHPDAAGVYFSRLHQILLDPNKMGGFDHNDVAFLVVHEAAHAAMTRALDGYKWYKNFLNEYKGLNKKINAAHDLADFLAGEKGAADLTTKSREKLANQILEAVPHLQKVEKIFNHLTEKGFSKGAYGMTNLDEFAAETMSNRVFQMALAKETLPDGLRVRAEKRSAFASIVELVSRMFNADKKGNALESATRAMEQIMLVADPLAHRGNDVHAFEPSSYALPLSEVESNADVKRDYEYRLAELNSQADFYHDLFDKPAAAVQMKFADYVKNVLGIFNPERSIADVQKRIEGSGKDLKINPDLRLNTSKGAANSVPAPEDRIQLTKKVVENATNSMLKLQTKAGELKDSIEGNEREVKRVQNRFVKFETMLHDILAIRDNALLTMKKGLKGAERNAERLGIWSARHDGLAGIAAELFRVPDEESIPDDYAELLIDAVDNHTHDTYFTDILTKATRGNIDFDVLTPQQIESSLRDLAGRTNDADLIRISDGSPEARAELALITYYAKTQPADMAALGIRIEQDPDQKDYILRAIKRIIRENITDTGGLNDLFKDVRKGDVRVGKAQRALTEVAKQLKQATTHLESAKTKSTEMELAAKAIRDGMRPYQAELGVRADRFEPYHGAKLMLTPDVNTVAEDRGTLNLTPSGADASVKTMMDNKKWLDKNDNLHDPVYWAIKDQYEGLKWVDSKRAEGLFRTTFLDKMLGSMPDRLDKTGVAMARQAGNRIRRFFSERTSADGLIQKGYQISEHFKDAMNAVGMKNSFNGYKETFFNPGAHFLRHLKLLPGKDLETNMQYAKEQLRQYYMRSDYTRQILQKTDGFDKVWESLYQNWKLGSNPTAKFAERVGALVEDDEIRVQNPRTGLVENAKRPAMAVGLFTTQSDISKVFSKKTLLDEIKNQAGEGLWAKWAETKQMPDDPSKIFTDEAIHHFVRPYVYDTGTLHFTSPEFLDDKTTTKASPMNVQMAFEASGGDMTKFANNLFDLEYTLSDQGDYVDHNARRKQFVEDTLGFFRDQYQKIYNMTKKQEMLNKKLGPYLLSSPMMDNVKAGDFPPEFMDYYLYDHTTLRQITTNLAAHGTLGRDLGMFDKASDPNKGILWELDTARGQLHAQQAEYTRLSEEAKRLNPIATVAEIDSFIEKKVGKDKLEQLKNLVPAQKELRDIESNVIGHFSSPNGTSREMSMAQELVRTVTSGMLSNFKSAINASNQIFEPFMKLGFSRAAFKQTGRQMESVARSGMGSFVQAITGQAKLANEWGRYMNDVGVGLDPANSLTSAQIMSDRGKNNLYEDARALGWLRKGRSLIFDTGFKGDEGERIAPAFRPWAPFSMMMIATNQAAIESHLRLFNDALKAGMEKMDATPGSRNDPSFKFSHTDIKFADNSFDHLAYDRFADDFRRMGTTIESEVRQLLDLRDQGKPLGNIVISPDLARLISGEALRAMSLPNDISSAPTWFSNHPVGRLAMPLLTWSVNKTNQLVNTIREPNGEISRRAAMSAVTALAFAMVPSALAITLLTDQYDENITGKKSNLVGYNFDSPGQTAAALIERVGRVGTFGLAGDVVNGIRAYGMDGDLRSLSVDQRVVFLNEMHQILGLANVLYNQEGTLTYDTFYRPLINAMGGGGILQNQEILNNITNSVMGVPIFQHEAETTARLNALNYLRGAGRVTGMDVRTASGESALPNTIKPWVARMVVSAYGNNQAQFAESYQEAIAAAKDAGRPDAEDYVKRSFESYHPLRITFRTPPSPAEVQQMYGAMSDKGRQDVSAALAAFNQYGAMLGLKPYEGKANTVAKTAPSAFPQIRP